ncbi:P pilus assembly chaperone PapD [Sphingobium sp. B11D3B]|uniref:fimbrial biogenesis chaperone n=1 Tax=Sphingobium sp. B11D3B TaxID=2940575 RepID=UPI0022276241|nr:hypothetical protein [Sphingobium sp. B11D3B]MCW2387188.1 P pilus assembly chaperone PapD [Sphingobium sp. B11D3B]
MLSRSQHVWRGRSALLAFLSIAALSVGNAQAAITVEKTLVAETPEAFEKGVAYPLIGLHGADPTYLSVRVYKWTQRGDDMYVLEPTDDFTVYPELVRISSDTRKSVTIKAAKPLQRGTEGDYRIVLREFDRADGTDNPPPESEAMMTLRVKPQASVPMIVRAPAAARALPLEIEGMREAPPPSAAEKASGARPGQLLRLRNPGPVYQRIVALGVNQPAGEKNQLVGYVLPGQSIDLNVPLKQGDRVEVLYASGPDAKVDLRSQRPDDRQVVSWTVQ